MISLLDTPELSVTVKVGTYPVVMFTVNATVQLDPPGMVALTWLTLTETSFNPRTEEGLMGTVQLVEF